MKNFLIIVLMFFISACSSTDRIKDVQVINTPTEYLESFVPVPVICQDDKGQSVVVVKPKNFPLDKPPIGLDPRVQSEQLRKQDSLVESYLAPLEKAAIACGVVIKEE